MHEDENICKTLYIVLIAWLNQYLVLNCPCNWFLCVPIWEMQSVQTVCGIFSALHTLLSLYYCASSTIVPFGWWCTGFFYVKGALSFWERKWLWFMEIHERQGFGGWSFPLFYLPKRWWSALRIKNHWANRRNDSLPKQSRAEFGVPAVLWSEERAQ